MRYVSNKKPLFVPNCMTMEASETHLIMLSPKTQSISDALQLGGLLRIASKISSSATIITPTEIQSKWSAYAGNNSCKLKPKVINKMRDLYKIGKKNRKCKVGAERAHKILVDSLI